jgi:hypothetical protein
MTILTPIERLKDLDAEIQALTDKITNLRDLRRQIIDAEAQKIATLKIGQDVEMSWGYRGATKRHRITGIRGSYQSYSQAKPFTAEYYGHPIKKDGTLGKSAGRLYNIRSIHPMDGESDNGK